MNRFSVITNAPNFTKGYVKEFRVRWACEELGLPYEEIRFEHAELSTEEYKKKQPFSQVPYFESEEVEMFESGAIILHLALKHGKIISSDERTRARTLTWLFAALNSIEPYVAQVAVVNLFCKGQEWAELRRPAVISNLAKKLAELTTALGDREYFAGEFSVADIAMTTVLRDAMGAKIMSDYPSLIAYKERNEARPAFKRALEAHQKLY